MGDLPPRLDSRRHVRVQVFRYSATRVLSRSPERFKIPRSKTWTRLSVNEMETSARDRKRVSARKKSDFSVYSQKAVRAKENMSVVKVKNATNQKNHLLKTKNGS